MPLNARTRGERNKLLTAFFAPSKRSYTRKTLNPIRETDITENTRFTGRRSEERSEEEEVRRKKKKKKKKKNKKKKKKEEEKKKKKTTRKENR